MNEDKISNGDATCMLVRLMQPWRPPVIPCHWNRANLKLYITRQNATDVKKTDCFGQCAMGVAPWATPPTQTLADATTAALQNKKKRRSRHTLPLQTDPVPYPCGALPEHAYLQNRKSRS
jgi:hypothetical protein